MSTVANITAPNAGTEDLEISLEELASAIEGPDDEGGPHPAMRCGGCGCGHCRCGHCGCGHCGCGHCGCGGCGCGHCR